MKSLLLAAAAAGLMAGAAQAQMASPDADGDGKVTFEEYQAASGGMMGRLDTDNDEKISQAEVAERPMLSQMFARLDADHDGFISKAEMTAIARLRFDRADANHDGWLSKEEMATMRQNRDRGGQPSS